MVTGLGKRIGLFGGSFNPAHEGHLYISEIALEKLGLDEVWWLVAPKNPLKDAASLAPFETRLKAAKKISEGKAIKVLDFENKQNLFFTIDAIHFIKENFANHSFAWLMGADCFKDLHRWKAWAEIMNEMPIAVFPRSGYTKDALSGIAATEYNKNRLLGVQAPNLVVTKPPAWVYIDCKRHPASATKIRGQASSD